MIHSIRKRCAEPIVAGFELPKGRSYDEHFYDCDRFFDPTGVRRERDHTATCFDLAGVGDLYVYADDRLRVHVLIEKGQACGAIARLDDGMFDAATTPSYKLGCVGHTIVQFHQEDFPHDDGSDSDDYIEVALQWQQHHIDIRHGVKPASVFDPEEHRSESPLSRWDRLDDDMSLNSYRDGLSEGSDDD